MPRIAYANGRYLPHRAASVHIEDRGYQFADGIYEVVHVRDGRLIDADLHFDRFDYSLGELRIAPPMTRAGMRLMLRELIARNGLRNGIVYFQATRGVAPRDHKFPARAETSLVATVKHLNPLAPALLAEGVAVVTIPDIRWQRCDIKTISLIGNVLGKQQAREAGAYEAWMVDGDGRVTEGTSTNAWIVTGDNLVVTRPAENAILNGVTRQALIAIIRREGYEFTERAFTVAEAKTAREAFLTSTTSDVTPVVAIDGQPLANGVPGLLTQKLRADYLAHVAE
jgi:D-alanine transaminase